MGKFLPFMTNDYSIGLYDDEVNDIYHSAFGAKTEAFEKFVSSAMESLNLLDKSTNINVLDICYGIGYNSKVFIQEMSKTNNKIHIDCVDTNKILFELSPFIKTYINPLERFIYKNKLLKNISDYSTANKITNQKTKRTSDYKIDNFVNVIILKNLIEQFGINFLSNESKSIFTKNENLPFINKNMLNLFEFYRKNEMYLYQIENNLPFVHNIYYKYVSKRNKIYNHTYDFDNIKMEFYDVDIRQFVQKTSMTYDVVFLDGFTPAKCPCIWSVDFFSQLCNILDKAGVIVTYNKSAPVRCAMREAGLLVGKTLLNNKEIGTICSKDISKIRFPLSNKQKGLLDTKAGIPYRDKNLCQENKSIIKNRNKEISESNLMSSSQFLKDYKNEI